MTSLHATDRATATGPGPASAPIDDTVGAEPVLGTLVGLHASLQKFGLFAYSSELLAQK